MGVDWTVDEVQKTVADYFAMLQLELLNQPYSKTLHRKQLLPQLQGRSDGAIEFKHQNISAVLVNMGQPYIEGYRPRGNYQELLEEAVEDYLAEHTGFFENLTTAPVLDPQQEPATAAIQIAQVFDTPPERIQPPKHTNRAAARFTKIDFARRDAENRRLGRRGEKFVVELEKRRLLEAKRDDLAKKIEWVSHTLGDGAGYDIVSFDEQTDSERLIEVKTTGLGKFFPFYVSANEVRFSEQNAVKYHLYRVFNFSSVPKVYVLQGALSLTCRLKAALYKPIF